MTPFEIQLEASRVTVASSLAVGLRLPKPLSVDLRPDAERVMWSLQRQEGEAALMAILREVQQRLAGAVVEADCAALAEMLIDAYEPLYDPGAAAEPPPGPAAGLASFLGAQKSDQGPVVFHFGSAAQQVAVALPVQELNTLIAATVAQLPPSLDDAGKPLSPEIRVFTAGSTASFHQRDGSMVIAVTLATGGQLALLLNSDLREALTRTLNEAQADLERRKAEDDWG
jgi:hypothetical protein